MSTVQTKVEAQIPKFDLREKHSNHERLHDPEVLLEKISENEKVKELRVNGGEFSLEIMQAYKLEVLYLDDVWGSERFHDGHRKVVETTFEQEISAGHVHIRQGY